MSLYEYILFQKYSKEIQQIKAEKGKDYTVTVDNIKRLLNIKDVPWNNCLGFTVK